MLGGTGSWLWPGNFWNNQWFMFQVHDKQNPKNRDYVKFVDLLTGWLIVVFYEWLKVNLEVVIKELLSRSKT